MSTMLSIRKSRTVGELTRRPIFITACVAGLAATLVGCASSSSHAMRPGGHTNPGAMYTNQLADRAAVTIDPTSTVGRYDAQWYTQRAGEASLPPLWLGEAMQSTVDTQTLRAQAIAARVAQQANESAALANAEAAMHGALSDEQISIAQADRFREASDAKIAELTTKVTADESAFESKARLNDALLASMAQERQAEFEKMSSQAVKEFDQAQADHERMLGQRKAVEQNGLAEIAKMIKIADMTESRAASKVKSLRVQADTALAQSDAQGDDLNQQIQSHTEQIAAQSKNLREHAAAFDEQGDATSSELLAQADALDQRDVDKQYHLKNTAADLIFAQATSAFNESVQQADAMEKESAAAFARKQADAEKFIQSAEAQYTQQIAATQRFKEQHLADVFVSRARADKVESESRAEFVKAQAEALAQSAREQAAHLNDLAQKQFDEITAQAQADAAKIRTEMLAQLAQQMQAGSSELPGKVDGASVPTSNNKESNNTNSPVTQSASSVSVDTAVPAQPQVAAAAPVIVPEHVAKFKSALANVTKIRAQADAQENSILATFQERTKKLDAWWNQQQAAHQQQLAQAEGFDRQQKSLAQDLRNKADKSLSLAQAVQKRSKAEAEAFRMETFAHITSLRAQAQKIKEQQTAEATRLLAQAEAVDAGGAADIRALEAQRDAVHRRGVAQSRQLTAEANATEASQRALVAQMRQEIKSSNSILTAELTRLDQAAESYMQIAQATYDEATTVSSTFAEKTRIASDAITVDNEVERKIAQADVDHRRNLVNARELAGQANVERLMAQATAQRELAESDDIATRAGVYSQSQIANASFNATLTTADAKDEAVRSIFESRIASVLADRDRAYAQRYLSDSQQQARLAKAQAAASAYNDLSNAAMAMLHEKQAAFETSAKINWDARLAMPASSVELAWPSHDPTFKGMPGDGALNTPPAFADVYEDNDFDNN